MIIRLLVICLGLLYLSGCGSSGGGSNPPTFSQIPDDTTLKIYGVTEGSVMSRNSIYATIDRSSSGAFRQYSAIQYTLDTQLQAYTPAISFSGNDTIQVTIPITKSGPHQFAVRGILNANSGGGVDPGKKINFIVDYKLDSAGLGKYSGDRTVYTETDTDKFANMRVEFAEYAASKVTNNTATSEMKLTNLFGDSISYTGSTNMLDPDPNTTDDPYFKIQSVMGSSSSDSVLATGTGFNHFMELLLLQGSTTKGDLRVYRSDSSSKVISAYCSSLNGKSQNSPEIETVISLHSFDNVNFFGHLRLWNKGEGKVWTYQVAAYANSKGLSASNNSLVLWPSIPTSPYDDFLLGQNIYPNQYRLVNPPGAKTAQTPGFLTVVLDADGMFKIDTLSLTLDDIYIADPDNIHMKMSYKP